MNIRGICFAVLAFACAATPSSARIMAILSYDELWEKSDLVAIANPVTKTADTTEKTYFPELRRMYPDGTGGEVVAIGVETVFEVLVVLKGDNATKRFVLHHYRRADDQQAVLNGPQVVSFDPDDRRGGGVLLFLIREDDGRYAPYGGQTDPSGRAVFSLKPPR